MQKDGHPSGNMGDAATLDQNFDPRRRLLRLFASIYLAAPISTFRGEHVFNTHSLSADIGLVPVAPTNEAPTPRRQQLQRAAAGVARAGGGGGARRRSVFHQRSRRAIKAQTAGVCGVDFSLYYRARRVQTR